MAVLQFSQEIIMCIEGLCNIPHQCSSHIFAIVSECEPHRSVVLQFLSQVEVLPQYRHEYLIKNNGLVGVGIEVPIHEAAIGKRTPCCSIPEAITVTDKILFKLPKEG